MDKQFEKERQWDKASAEVWVDVMEGFRISKNYIEPPDIYILPPRVMELLTKEGILD